MIYLGHNALFESKMVILGSEIVILRAHDVQFDELSTNTGYCIMLGAMKSFWDQNITWKLLFLIAHFQSKECIFWHMGIFPIFSQKYQNSFPARKLRLFVRFCVFPILSIGMKLWEKYKTIMFLSKNFHEKCSEFTLIFSLF